MFHGRSAVRLLRLSGPAVGSDATQSSLPFRISLLSHPLQLICTRLEYQEANHGAEDNDHAQAAYDRHHVVRSEVLVLVIVPKRG